MRDRKFLGIPLTFLLLTIVLGSMLTFSSPPVVASVGCGATITTNTTLNSSIGPCSSGLIIGASGITLNCAGFTISGATSSVLGIDLVGVSGVIVKNCKVTDFQFGFYVYGSSGNTLTGNTANSNTEYGFFLSGSSGNTLTGNTANGNKLHGFFLSGSTGNSLSGNTANGNNAYGISDGTTGSGTAGTANSYTLNTCSGNGIGRSSPPGLCTGLLAGAITPSAPIIDAGQSVTLAANLLGGTAPYVYQWYTSSDCSTSPISGATSSTYVASPASTTTYYFKVTDNSSPQETACSPGDTVTVNPSLVSGAITPSAPSINSGQSITLTSHASGGTSPYTYQWYTGVGCTVAIGGAISVTYTSSPPSTTTFYVKVIDSASTPSTACSAGDTVTVTATTTTVTTTSTTTTVSSSTSTTTYSTTSTTSITMTATITSTTISTTIGSTTSTATATFTATTTKSPTTTTMTTTTTTLPTTTSTATATQTATVTVSPTTTTMTTIITALPTTTTSITTTKTTALSTVTFSIIVVEPTTVAMTVFQPTTITTTISQGTVVAITVIQPTTIVHQTTIVQTQIQTQNRTIIQTTIRPTTITQPTTRTETTREPAVISTTTTTTTLETSTASNISDFWIYAVAIGLLIVLITVGVWVVFRRRKSPS